MPIALDGFDVLQRLGKHAEVFAVVRADVDKAAHALVVKCLKAKPTGSDALRHIYAALGGDQFELVLEGLKDADVKSILTRLDKHHPDLKVAEASWRRQHLKALAEGSSNPSPPPVKATKKATAGKKAQSQPARLQSDVVELVRQEGKPKR
jgi:hypothetical protein